MTISASRHLREWVMLTAALLLLLVLAQRASWFERADNGLYDISMAWGGRPASDDILILAIDEASLARMGRWPWSRHALARVLETLTQAGSGPVLIDVILAEPQLQDPSADPHLAIAIAAHGQVVLPVFMPSPGASAVRPLPALAASARLGHAQALVDSDGVTRRYLAQEFDGSTAYPHLALQLRAAQSGSGPPTVADTSARLVPFAGPAGHFPRISVADVIDGRVDPQLLRGKTVLIGATAAGLGDTVVTPLAGRAGAMPGVEFVANVFDAERADRTRQIVPLPVRTALSVLVVLACLVALLLLSPRRALMLTAALVLGTPLLAWMVMLSTGWWWPPASVMAVLVLAYPLWSWRRLEASLITMTRETARIAGLLHPGVRAAAVVPSPRFMDPVENRIAAIIHAVDEVADALTLGGDVGKTQQVRDDMMRHLAHDLRSPLVSLRALADQLRVGSSAEHAAMIARVDACARRSLELTEQFLLIGRAQSVDRGQFNEVDLVQVLHSCADDLWEDAQSLDGHVARRCDMDLGLVMGDERLLRRAVLNLGWNALRHGPKGGTVTLSLEREGDRLVLAVHDQGVGFAEQDFAGLIHRYARGKAGSSGHGLGLALVQLVAEKHLVDLDVSHPTSGGFRIALRFLYSH